MSQRGHRERVALRQNIRFWPVAIPFKRSVRMMSSDVNGYPPRTMIPQDRWDSIGASLKLTGRELEIVQQLFGGATEVESGRALGISAHTVHTHLGRLYRKLNVHGCPGLFLRIFDAYIAGASPSENGAASENGSMFAFQNRPIR